MAKQGLKNPLAILSASEKAGQIVDSTKKTAKEVNDRTGNALAWLAVIGGGGALYFIFQQLNKINKLQNDVGETVGGLVDQVGDGFTIPGGGGGDVNGIDLGSLTINEVQAQFKATQLMDSMDRVGTNFDKIKSALRNINKADFVLIAQKFGTPRYNLVGSAPWPWPKRNLLEWLSLELDDDEVNELKNINPDVFGNAFEEKLNAPQQKEIVINF